jgi:hypothetical protein
MTAISLEDLVAELQGPSPLVLLDVRREQARAAPTNGGLLWPRSTGRSGGLARYAGGVPRPGKACTSSASSALTVMGRPHK